MSFRRGRQVALALILAFALAVVPLPTRAESELTAEEQVVLQQLFTLNRSLEEIQIEIEKLGQEIEDVTARESVLRAEIDRLEVRRKERLSKFGRRLRYYQEEGALAPFAYLITAQTLTEFLERLDLLMQLLRHDARLLSELRELKNQVAQDEQALGEQRERLVTLRTSQTKQRAELQAQIAEKEQILQSLLERRSAVEEEMARLEETWEKTAKPVLLQLGDALASVDLEGFQPDSVKATILPLGVTIRISEANLNQLLLGKADLKGMSVKILAEQISLEGGYGGTAIRVAGNFAVRGRAIMRFEPSEIWVGAYRVPEQILNEMLAEGSLDIDVTAVLRGFQLKDVWLEGKSLVIQAGM